MNYSLNIRQRLALANCFKNKYVIKSTLTLCSIIIMLCLCGGLAVAAPVPSDNGATLTVATVDEAINNDLTAEEKAAVTKVIITADVIAGDDYSATSDWGKLRSLNTTYANITALELTNVTEMPVYGGTSATASGTQSFMNTTGYVPAQMWMQSFSALKLKKLVGGAFHQQRNLVEVNLPALEVLGFGAFYYCNKLERISLPEVTTAEGYVGPYSVTGNTFYYCTALTSINMPKLEFVQAPYMFSSCSNLAEVSLPSLKTVSVASMFSSCSKLTEVDLPNLTTVTANSMFQSCSGLTEISLPKLETTAGNMFYSCTALMEVDLPELKTITSTYMFYNCRALTEISLPKLEMITANTAQIFYGCGALTNVSFAALKEIGTNQLTPAAGVASITQITDEMFPALEKINGVFLGTNITTISLSKVKELGTGAFSGLTKLTALNLPTLEIVATKAFEKCTFETITLQATTVDFTAFYGCANLKTVNLPKVITLTSDATIADLPTTIPNLTTINLDVIQAIPANIFQNFTALETITMPRVTSIGASAFSGCSNLALNITDNVVPALNNIRELAFSNCERITSIQKMFLAPAASAFSGCTGLESVSMQFATTLAPSTFAGCEKLETINFPYLTTIGSYAFGNCFALTSENLNFPSVTTINPNAFNRCEGLLTIGETNFPKLTAIEGFSNCVYLREVNFPKATIVKSNAFAGCIALANYNLPLVHTIEGQASSFPVGAFSGCVMFTTLTDANFPALNSIGANAFYGCDALTSVNLTKVTSLGSATFGGCTNLQTVELPALLTIAPASVVAQGTFNGCNSLTTITFPLATTVNGFTDCANLTEVYCPKATAVGANAFANLPKLTLLGLGSAVTTETAMAVNGAAFTGLATENVNLYLGENLTPEPDFDNSTWPTAATKWKSTVSDNGVSEPVLTFATLTDALNFRGSRRLARKIIITGQIAAADWSKFNTLNPAYPALEELEIRTTQAIPSATSANFLSNASWLKIFTATNTGQIGNYAFANCPNLTTITLGTGFTAATTITIPNAAAFNNTPTENIDLVLSPNVRPYPNLTTNTWNGFSWKSISVGGVATELTFVSATAATEYAQYPAAVRKITITGDIVGINYSGNSEWAKFRTLNQKYPSLSEITILTSQAIPDADVTVAGGQTTERGLFYQTGSYNDWLRVFSAPNSVSIGSVAFYRNSNLRMISFPEAVSVGSAAFSGCDNLTTIGKQHLPKAATIGDLAFANCNNLTEAELPLAFEIGVGAFMNCQNLIKAVLPKATTVLRDAFSGCVAINSMTIGTDLMSPAEVYLADMSGAEQFASNTDLTLGYYVSPVPVSLDDDNPANDSELRIWHGHTWRSINIAGPADYLYTVTLRVTPAGVGQTLLSNNGHRDSITVKATSTSACYRFVGWDNGHGILSNENPLNLFLTCDTVLTALFEQDSIEVTISASAGGTATPSGKTTLLCGNELIITATPATGYLFSSWVNATTGRIISNQSKDTLTYNEYTINRLIVAKFVKEEEPPVAVYTVVLLSSPEGAATLTGAGRYNENTTVTVTATANTNFIFESWTNSSGTTVSENTSYSFVVTSNTTLTANFTEILAPEIAEHPQDVTIPSGSSFTLSVVATGTDLQYQWKKDGVDISGATSSTYTKPSAVLSDAGKYVCVVSNTVGNATSDEATVTVTTGIEDYIANFSLSPNPASDFVTVRMDILQAGTVGISLVDINGAELLSLNNSFVEEGNFSKSISLANLPAAVYYVKITHNGKVRLEKVIRN